MMAFKPSISGAFALAMIVTAAVPALAEEQEQVTQDPLTCALEKVGQDPDYAARTFESFSGSMKGPRQDFTNDPAVMDPLQAALVPCAEAFSDNQEQMAIIALGVLGAQLLIEGRRRFAALNFNAQRFDALFVPALRKMPLDSLDLLTFRPPDYLKEPAFALRDELVEKSGKERGEITALLVVYTTGLVGREAAMRVIAEGPVSQ